MEAPMASSTCFCANMAAATSAGATSLTLSGRRSFAPRRASIRACANGEMGLVMAGPSADGTLVGGRSRSARKLVAGVARQAQIHDHGAERDERDEHEGDPEIVDMDDL